MGAGSNTKRTGGKIKVRRVGFLKRMARRVTKAVKGGVKKVRNTLNRIRR